VENLQIVPQRQSYIPPYNSGYYVSVIKTIGFF